MGLFEYKLEKISYTALFTNTATAETNLNTNYAQNGWQVISIIGDGSNVVAFFQRRIG